MRKLRSDITREGLARTPHRAFMRAMGLDDAAIQKPMIGVVSMKGEQTPCNMTHGFQVEAAKEGVGEADVTILDSYEAVGAVLTGAMDEATLARLERSCLPTVGACAGQFTANTMAMVSEALGLSVPNVSMIPGPYAERAGFARRAG